MSKTIVRRVYACMHLINARAFARVRRALYVRSLRMCQLVSDRHMQAAYYTYTYMHAPVCKHLDIHVCRAAWALWYMYPGIRILDNVHAYVCINMHAHKWRLITWASVVCAIVHHAQRVPELVSADDSVAEHWSLRSHGGDRALGVAAHGAYVSETLHVQINIIRTYMHDRIFICMHESLYACMHAYI